MAGDRIQIVLEEGGLQARLSVVAGEALAPGAIAAALDAAGIAHGIEEQRLAELEGRLADESFSLDRELIAQGTPAAAGADGVLEIEFEFGPLAGRTRSDGSLDLLDRGLLTKIRAGERLAHVQAPQAGKPGLLVTGEEIAAAAGVESTVLLGDGVEKLEAGTVQATRDGAIHFQPGRLLDVYTHYEHSGDVDIRSGHLKTNGSLSITGAVKQNFEVRAGGDVEIRGGVFGGRVDAGGNVQIAGALVGGETGHVRAGGDLYAQHAQTMELRSGGTISLATDSVASTLHARKLEVGRRLFGGESVVETSIVAAEAGSPSGAGTLLQVGEPLESQADVSRAESASSKAKRTIARRRSPLRDRKNARAKGGKESRANLALERERTKRRKALCAKRAELLEVAQIEIEHTVNAGVQIRFGTRHLHIEAPLAATRFRFDAEQRCITTEGIEA